MGTAAFYLAGMLADQGDFAQARGLYELAEADVDEEKACYANLALARILTSRGEVPAARVRAEAYLVERWGEDAFDDIPKVADFMIGPMRRPRVARFWWAVWRTRRRFGRRRAALVQSSASAAALARATAGVKRRSRLPSLQC